VRGADTTPNECNDCPVKVACHRGFGTSSAGHGLYPYNRSALLRAVRASALPEQPNLFNPRGALARVVLAVLQEHEDDVRSGEFPNEQFEAKFPPSRAETALPGNVKAQINTLDPKSGTRRQVLLQYWGDAPSRLCNLAPEIHEAFQLSALPANVIDDTPPPPVIHSGPEKPDQPVGPVDTPLPASVQRRLEPLEHWLSRKENFPPDLANEIRQTIRSAVLSRVPWVDPLMKEPSGPVLEKAWPKRGAFMVSIAGAAEAIAKNVEAPIRFERTPENAVFFAGLVKLKAGISEGTVHARLRLDELAEKHAAKVRAAVITERRIADEDLVKGVRASLIGAALAGAAVPGATDEILLNAAIADLNSFSRADEATRSPAWRAALERHLRARGPLVQTLREAVGVSQGSSGEVHGIDARRLLPLLREAASRWSVNPEDGAPDWVAPAQVPLYGLQALVDEQLKVLGELAAAVRSRLPVGTGLAQTAQAVDAAIEAGAGHGFVRHPNLPLLQARNKMVDGLTTRALERLESDLGSLLPESSFEDHLAVAAPDRGDTVPRVLTYLQENESWLDAGLAVPVGSESAETSMLLERLQAVVDDWGALVAERERHVQ
jgi:hypothetical protein